MVEVGIASAVHNRFKGSVSEGWSIVARDKPGLLRSMMRALAGHAHISFEGNLKHLDTSRMAVTHEDQTRLRRQPSTAQFDFVVLPLSQENEAEIWRMLSPADNLANDGVVHTQIEKEGRLAFGAYDNFYPCVFASDAVPLELLETLKKSGVIRSFQRAEG